MVFIVSRLLFSFLFFFSVASFEATWREALRYLFFLAGHARSANINVLDMRQGPVCVFTHTFAYRKIPLPEVTSLLRRGMFREGMEGLTVKEIKDLA